MCNQDVYIATLTYPFYQEIYDKNTEEIKENCRCLTPDLGQYIERT